MKPETTRISLSPSRKGMKATVTDPKMSRLEAASDKSVFFIS
jgi:hypothetical protein